MSQHIIEYTNVHYHYPDGRQAVGGVTCRINHGESVGIIGANGAGKSTLLMLLLGVLYPTKGEIHVSDILVEKRTLPIIRQRVGMVFQDSDDQLFMSTVYDDVAFGPRNYKLNETEITKRVLDSLDRVGITHLKDRAPYKLSGGEKRAAAIASVLSMNPEVLVMDEPTSGLDPKSRRRLINLLKSFPHTKIITSHDMDMIYELCDRSIILSDGKITADGLTEKILTDEDLLKKSALELPLSIQNCPICHTEKILNEHGDK